MQPVAFSARLRTIRVQTRRHTCVSAMLFVNISLVVLICIFVCECRDDFENASSSNDINSHQMTDSKIAANDDTNQFSIEQLYEEARLAYLEEDYEFCVELFEKTRKRYNTYKKETVQCRRKCQNESKKKKSIFTEYVGDMIFYERKIKETLCLMNCFRDYEKVHGAGTLIVLKPELANKLSELEDYEFTHICYYQLNRYKDAANAIYTYRIHHPENKMSLMYLNHYLTNPEVTKDPLIDLEAAPFVEKYNEAMKAYKNEDYVAAIEDFENSLHLYLSADDDCRFYCEGPFDQGWHHEFVVEIANHYTYSLQCKQNCTKWLSTVNGEYQSDLLANHYHYLQFAYYKVGKLADACSAVASYLLFYPVDETMLNNKKYYSAMPKFKPEYLTPRKEAVYFSKKQISEMILLKFIDEEFNVQIENEEKIDDKKAEKVLFKESSLKLNKFEQTSENDDLPDIKIIDTDKNLGGEMRYVAEGLLNNVECDLLTKMAQIAVTEGDGYTNNISPHSKFEIFEGATIGRMTLLTYLGILDPEPLELLLNVTEIAKNHIKNYFHLEKPLYFAYTHLTKRSSLDDAGINQDLSHKIHADNCIYFKGQCHRRYPAYTWRDFSAILYLNHDFLGGEFIFSNDTTAKVVQASVSPRCGLTTAFTADEKNLHGVRAVKRGSRFALALWFTHQNKYLEVERILARFVLERVRRYGSIKRNEILNISSIHDEILINLFHDDTLMQSILQN